ncbi:hypothetical protein E3J74_01335 [Candidatus Bathyarchaeota archaeon]|nr:MAG: hypothetical protein E3J74_01335 [Candidatus Bathyarchaeota archaeon]
MEMKLALVIGIVIGLIGGVTVGYLVAPKGVGTDTSALEQQISQLEGQVSTLESQVQEKDNQISNLTSQITELEQLVPPLTKGEWNTIITFTGSAYKTTELFHIPSETWRINWTYTGGSLAIFGFFVYPEGETVLPVETLSATGSSKSDATYIYEGQDNFYVKLLAANIDPWTLTVQAFIPS